ncbi:MAG: tripartite tricarboxylate transporter substrate-binding protein [Bilophila wadsworthia]
MKTFYALLLALGICLGLTFPAMAEYPAKPIMLMTAFNAGGGSDLSHRLIEKFAKGVIPQPIVVTYKAGAGGEIGWTRGWSARRRTGTISAAWISPYRAPAHAAPKGQPGYKTEQLIRFAASYRSGYSDRQRKEPVQEFRELIEYAKANPGKVKAATVGKLTATISFS